MSSLLLSKTNVRNDGVMECGNDSNLVSEKTFSSSPSTPVDLVQFQETGIGGGGGGSGRALKLQADSPHLVSLGGDRFSTAVTVHPLPSGQIIRVGSGRGVDIHVQGTGVEPLHCKIENDNGIVTLYPLSENLAIDGIQITKSTRLTQGVMLMIGRSNYLRFNHPEEAKLMKSVLPNARISMTPIKFDVHDSEVKDESPEVKYDKKPPSIPRKNNPPQDQPFSSIQMKVSKFEYLAAQNFKKSICPKVFSSNMITVNTPAKDVLGKAPPDLQDFAKNLPQSALNYSDSFFNDDKQKNKTPDRQFFGRKSPHQYVNVSITDSKSINNKVVLFEGVKNTNKTSNVEKQTNNLFANSYVQPNNLSPGVRNNNNTLPTVRHRSLTPNPNNNNQTVHRRSGSLGDLFENNGNDLGLSQNLNGLVLRNNEAEIKRNKAQVDRIKEQEVEKAEQERLEEILNMCAEYEKQVQWEKSKVSTPNRIKTNGSLPRDKRQCGNSSPLSPASAKSNDSTVFNFESYENVNYNHSPLNKKVHYENVEILKEARAKDCGSMYENVYINQTQPTNVKYFPQSPRTRIKTIPSSFSSTKDPFSKEPETMDIIENKFVNLDRSKSDEKKSLIDLNTEKQKILSSMVVLRRKITEIKMQESELNRELEMEKALITGEYKSKMFQLQEMETRKQVLLNRAHELESKMEDCKMCQTANQETCKRRLAKAQETLNEIEKKLAEMSKNSPEYEHVFEKYLEAQEVLDNERKTFEDIEFHQLEEEANWLAGREEIQREIMELMQNMEVTEAQIADLEKQKFLTTKNTSEENENLRKQLISLSISLEEHKKRLKIVEDQLNGVVSRSESDQEFSSETDEEIDVKSTPKATFESMSVSLIETNTGKNVYEDISNMSQSFNEKMLQEKFILDQSTAEKKFPSQDDIDRFSRVTLDAPMNIDEGRGSMGKKTIESLKEIERNRQIHLVQQGSQVIEEERRRVSALKLRIQEEVRSQWKQRNKTGEDSCAPENQNSISNNEDYIKTTRDNDKFSTCDNRTKSAPEVVDFPNRPLSESSDFSVEGGGTLGRQKRQLPDKARPLTRYLPIRSSELDLRQHIETAGHQVVLCPHVKINSFSCRGFLHKRGSKLNNWSRRWFVFDRNRHTLTYYTDKSEKKARGGAYFQAIEEVYLDHSNSVKSPNPLLTFIVKTHERYYYLMAPSPEAMRIWIDVIFTGAEGYREFEHGT